MKFAVHRGPFSVSLGRNSHSLRNKLVRAKLPTEDTERESNDTTLNPDTTQSTNLPDDYPSAFSTKHHKTLETPSPDIKNCIICKMLATYLFARSTTKKTKHQITLPPEDQHYNCKSKNVIYLVTCNHKNCAAQYIGYTTRPLRDRIYEHIQTNTSAIYKHCNQLEHPLQKIKFQILTQAPTDTKNKDLWLRQHEYNWICKLGTSKKLDKRGLNSTFYDSTER